MTKPATKTAAATKIRKGTTGRFEHKPFGNNWARRPITDAELAEWRASDASKGMDDAGETKLPPSATSISLTGEEKITIEKARARVRLGCYDYDRQVAVRIEGHEGIFYFARSRFLPDA